MKRRIIAPWQFGTVTPYPWLAFDAAEAGGLAPHFDYLTTYREVSFRLWEPGREEYSAAGYESLDNPVQIPATTTLHGVKGHIDICMGYRDNDYGLWWTGDGVPISLENGGDPNTMSFEQASMTLYGTPYLANLIDWNISSTAWEQEYATLIRQAKLLRIPMFFCMYRGTYKQLDDTTGWEIDSGPADDPDTLLSVDITNPNVLESSRIDWWDMEMFQLPMPYTQYNLVQPMGQGNRQEPTYSTEGRSGFVRYPLNLDANKTLGPDQVLWMHLKSGMIRMQGLYQDEEGTVTFGDVLYQGHQFAAHIHCSALVSAKLSL